MVVEMLREKDKLMKELPGKIASNMGYPQKHTRHHLGPLFPTCLDLQANTPECNLAIWTQEILLTDEASCQQRPSFLLVDFRYVHDAERVWNGPFDMLASCFCGWGECDLRRKNEVPACVQ